VEESMKKRFQGAEKALTKLHEGVTKESLTEMERDGLIQRFEFAFEIMWMCGKDYLLDREGLEAASPKKVIRTLRQVGLFSDEEAELALKMADDRNLTVHTYDEKMAIALSERIIAYEKLLADWLDRMRA
jgi:nucleotidyltransferase substrate binding protein (TIGR01987 family)